MTDLKPITALGAETARYETFGALTISENVDLGLASLALRDGKTVPAPFGICLPEAGRWTAGDGFAAFWMSPGQWMIEAEGRGNDDFAAALKAEVHGCSVTEQTDGWVAFEIAAQNVAALEALMQKSVNLDPASLSSGAAARTGLEHMGVYLIRRSETQLAVMGMRTFAEALWHALATAARRLPHTA